MSLSEFKVYKVVILTKGVFVSGCVQCMLKHTHARTGTRGP